MRHNKGLFAVSGSRSGKIASTLRRPDDHDGPPMRLMLLRHAKAEKAEPGERDHERALNDRGHKDAARIGAYLAKHALVPDAVLVSTARRTRETWDGVAQALSGKPAVRFEERLYNGTAATAFWRCCARPSPRNRLCW